MPLSNKKVTWSDELFPDTLRDTLEKNLEKKARVRGILCAGMYTISYYSSYSS